MFLVYTELLWYNIIDMVLCRFFQMCFTEDEVMLDLAARVYYKAHFDIVRECDNLDLLRDVIVTDIVKWLKRKHYGVVKHWNWAQFSKYGRFDSDDHRLIANTTSFSEDGARYWACKTEEFEDAPDDDDDSVTTLKKAPRIWTTWTALTEVDTKSNPGRRISEDYAALRRISSGVRPFFMSMRS